jgi:uncharacterized protein DUF4129
VRRWVPRLVLAVAVALSAGGVALAQEHVDAGAFRARLRQAAELARQGIADPSSARMDEVRAAIGLPLEVELGGWTAVVDTDPLLAGLVGDDAAEFERTALRIAALERSLDDALARDAPDPAGVAAALDEAFRGVVPPRPNPAEIILRALGEVLEAILYRIGAALGAAGTPLAWLIVVAVVAGAAFVVLRQTRFLPDRALPAGAAGTVTASVDWMRVADDAVRAGDLREAVRALYRALLVSLGGGGVLADAPALTAGEARSAVRRNRPALFPEVARATEAYERVIYGGADPVDDDLSSLRRAAIEARRR